MKVVALAGGTGSAKLLRGLSALGVELTVVGNVGDNIWMHGLYVCPDLDIAMYTLAGVENRRLGWGLEGDTFRALAQLGRMGESTWFSLGDMDLAISVLRTKLLREGRALTAVTEKLRRALGVRQRLLPISDEPVETRIVTPAGELHLQEFWVRERGRPTVKGVKYAGSSRARPTKEVEAAIADADRIVLCPANPVTSIGPMLAVQGFPELLARAGGRVSSLSPLVGRTPFSGPAGKLMKAVGLRADSVGAAERYSGFLDSMIIHERDASLVSAIEKLGIVCRLSNTKMSGPRDERRLAKELLEA